MECVAYSLTNDTNKLLLQLSKQVFIDNELFIIDKFHLSIFVGNHNDSLQLIDLIKEKKINIKQKKYIVLQGKNTDFEYLALEIELPKELYLEIEKFRKMKLKKQYYKLNTHISLIKTKKNTIKKEELIRLNKTLNNNKLYIEDIILFNENQKIIKKVDIIS